MAKKKAEAAQADAPRSTSKLRAGTGSRRSTTRGVVIYGPPKSLKTTSCASLPLGKTKWLVADSNAIATLTSLNRLPHPDDLYEVKDLYAALQLTDEMLTLAETDGVDALGIEYFVVDSLTQLLDWHQQDVSKETGQNYLGDNEKKNGWQQFNAQFGRFLDNLASLTRFCTVIAIAHSKEKVDSKKGEWAGLNLNPAMAQKGARLSNWILYKTYTEVYDDGTENLDGPLIEKVETDGAAPRFFKSALHTRPFHEWIASVNCVFVHVHNESALCANGDIKNGSCSECGKKVRPILDAQEPGDLLHLFTKAGLA